MGRTEYCSVNGVKDEPKTRRVRARISPADGGVGPIGRKPGEFAKEFGCHETSISARGRHAHDDERGGRRPDAPLTTAERQEFAQLRRQLRQVTLERDILAKATAWFANKDGSIDKASTR